MPVDDKSPDDIVVDYARELAEQLSAVVAHKGVRTKKPAHFGRDYRQAPSSADVFNRWAASASRIGAGNE